jgi:hypothetical protein
LETGKRVIGRLEIFYHHEDWADVPEARKILCRLESYSGYWADINEVILWKTERVLETGNLLWRLKGI